MGRLRRELSPVTVKKRPPEAASSPNINLRVVPELPAFKISGGSHRLFKPTPWTITFSEFSWDISAPIVLKQLAVLRGSFPNNNPSMVVCPEAIAPSIKARWEIDLSPGTLIVPVKDSPDEGGWMIKFGFLGVGERFIMGVDIAEV